MIVLDTNVISEVARRAPEPTVVRWLDGQHAADLYLTAVTVAELSYGVARLPAGARRDDVVARVERVLDALAPRVLALDVAAAQAFGAVAAARDRAGWPIGTADGQIAALCLMHGATLATRNGRDFVGTGVDVVDPWKARP
ncbi:type II toxin-antitoxin system VapC family toxin [Cellulosimicrobium sp. CUA-896]|uniref:type II toxin-antitoxin system VapC family toxin n=1 Tax=Cellulosimicrobium sp. CUA-896 TaxID=1517881 RepID=UPI000968D0C8|nr:type II toxin-antitoxin system VapC family toxin [Cellulosimicrobium sp. CUA-896]OLT55095.1 plasmid stabilization protein [Cellulosimicrobium sp. CUA-896]